VFGASCNLLFLILTLYHDDSVSWQRMRLYDWGYLLFATCIVLAPSLVLFAFRHSFAVVVIYASILFSMLVWRIEYPHYLARKYDDPAVALVFFGMISAGILSLWVVIRLWRALKANGARQS
jgi:hypothetical protein